MKKYLAILFTAATLVAGPAVAQDSAPPDPAALAASQQLVDALHFRELMNWSMQQMMALIPGQLRTSLTKAINGNPAMSPEARRKALARLEAELPKMQADLQATFGDPTLTDEVITEIVPLYARIYTVDEINQLAAFYKSPLGQKVLSTMPQLVSESMAISNRIMIPRLQKAMQESALKFSKKEM